MKPTVRLAANVSTLFTEVPLLERFARAASAGFTAVESWWPEETDLDAFVEAIGDAGVDLVLLNFFGGTLAAGDRGVLANLEREHEFRANVPLALEVAARVGCPQLHALVGKEEPGQPRDDQLRVAVENVRWAADLAAQQKATVLVEPLSSADDDRFLLRGLDSALAFIIEVRRENVGLQFDSYHVQRTAGNVHEHVEQCAPLLRHVQLADAPGRGRPGGGAIDFPKLFSALTRAAFSGHVGLEYFPAGSTEEELAWLPRRLRGGRVSLESVGDAIP